MKTKIILNSSLVLLLSACNGNGLINSSHNEISVASEPGGASVYVMGELQGVTPMAVNITKLYPVTYSKENEQLYGRITLKHEGCSDKTIKITYGIDSAGVKENLVCAASEDSVVEQAPVNASAMEGKTVKQRLQELQKLKDDDLINGEEYQKIRSRILESL